MAMNGTIVGLNKKSLPLIDMDAELKNSKRRSAGASGSTRRRITG